MKNITYIIFAFLGVFFLSCNDIEDVDLSPVSAPMESPALVAGSADFSTYVALGNSLTAGFTDGALFQAAQQNSLPNLLASKFALVGGSESFTQPLTNDNIGGLLIGGNQLPDFNPRLVFNGSGPVGLSEVVGPVSPTTDIALNNPEGPFNNLGVPGAKSFHLLAPGYGNLANLEAQLANPYYIRMTGSTPDAPIIELAMAQSPSFFSLWIGNNDVLGYATTGGDGTNPITDQATFNAAVGALVGTLTSQGAQGAMANIPDVATIPHFTTVPFNPINPSENNFAAQVPTLNTVYGALNQVYEAVGQPERAIVFSDSSPNAVVIQDESLADLSQTIIGALNGNPAFPVFVQQLGLPAEAAPLVANLLGATYGQTRFATADDLLVLPSSSIIGQPNQERLSALIGAGLPPETAGQFSVEGVTLPLEDKWVLIPEEQAEIAAAVEAFNATLSAAASEAGLAFVDANNLLQQLADGGLTEGQYVLNANLVTGGAFSLDGIHLTARGNATVANEFMRAIDATYGSNFEASGSLFDIGEYPTNYSPALQ